MNLILRAVLTAVLCLMISVILKAQIFQQGYTQGPIRHNSFHYEVVMITNEMIFSPQLIYERIFYEYPHIFIGLSAGFGPFTGVNSFGSTARIGASLVTNKHGMDHFEYGVDGLYIYNFNNKTGEIVPQIKFGFRLEDIYKKKIRFKAGINVGPLQIIDDFKAPYDYLGAYVGFIHRI